MLLESPGLSYPRRQHGHESTVTCSPSTWLEWARLRTQGAVPSPANVVSG